MSPAGFERFEYADVVGDPEPEVLKQVRGGKALQVSDRGGRILTTLAPGYYVTDFGAIHASRPDKNDVVLYLYPTTPERAGTFSIVALPDEKTIATWDVHPATAWFAVGPWKGREALQEMERENAYRIDDVEGGANGSSWTVSTFSGRWRYRNGPTR